MKTDIEYLRRLEADLEEVVSRETGRQQADELRGSIKRNAGRRWARIAGAAAFLLIAGSIGYLATVGSDRDLFQVSGDAGADGSGGGSFAQDPVAVPAPADESDGEQSGVDDEGSAGSQGDLSKIVRDGRIGIVVDDGGFDEAVGDLTFIAEEHGGFILSSASQNERSGTFVLRIPANRFDRAIADVRDLAFRGRIRFQQIEGDDVTAEYVDNEARLRILRDRMARLKSLEDDADTTAEILALGRQIDEVQLRIEQIQGQLRFLDDQIAESTLRVSIQERGAPAVVPPEEIDNPDLGSAFALAYQGVLRIVTAVVVGLGYLVPIVALGALVWFAVVTIRRRRALA